VLDLVARSYSSRWLNCRPRPRRDQSSHRWIARQSPAPVRKAARPLLGWLGRRVETGLELPFHAYDLLDQLGVTDEGRIASTILDVSHDSRELNAMAVMAGPKTVTALVDKYLACAQALRGSAGAIPAVLSDEYHRLLSRIAGTRAPSLLVAVMAHADTDDPALISSLASLVFLHGDHDDRKSPIPVAPDLKPQLIGMLRSWAERVIVSPAAGRHDLNEVSNAIGRIGFRELLPELKRLLDEDLARLKKAREGTKTRRYSRNV
jgi:hypothetical protein